MGVLRESPWYQEILREGEARAEARAEARGEIKGMIVSIEISLEAKFGSQGLDLMSRISPIQDLEQLHRIFRTIVLANSVDEIQQVI